MAMVNCIVRGVICNITKLKAVIHYLNDTVTTTKVKVLILKRSPKLSASFIIIIRVF